MYVNTPIITASDCEGAGEMFRVTTIDPANPPLVSEEQAAASNGELTAGEVDWSQDFFGVPASLTVSGQLNAENFAMAFGDVYTFGPTQNDDLLLEAQTLTGDWRGSVMLSELAEDGQSRNNYSFDAEMTF